MNQVSIAEFGVGRGVRRLMDVQAWTFVLVGIYASALYIGVAIWSRRAGSTKRVLRGRRRVCLAARQRHGDRRRLDVGRGQLHLDGRS